MIYNNQSYYFKNNIIFFAHKLFFISLASLIILLISGCGTGTNLSKSLSNDNLIYTTNSINFFSKPKDKTSVYIKVINFSNSPYLVAQDYLINHINMDKKYVIVNSPQEAELILEIRVMTIIPVAEESIERITKYWAYKSITDHDIIDESNKLENNNANFLIEEPDITLITGNGKHSIRHSSNKNPNPILVKNQTDIAPGAVIGGSIGALLGFNPALISLGVVTGAGIGSALQHFTLISYKMAIIDIVIKEKIYNQPENLTKTKYKNISSLSKNTTKEMYIENNAGKNDFFEHNTRVSVIAGSMIIMPPKIYALINFAITQTISEILR